MEKNKLLHFITGLTYDKTGVLNLLGLQQLNTVNFVSTSSQNEISNDFLYQYKI